MVWNRFSTPSLARHLCRLSLAGLLVGLLGCAQNEQPDRKVVQLAPGEAEHFADSIRQQVAVDVADSLELSLWAADPLAPDPIALTLDNQGRAYITRTNRQKNSEFDIRPHEDWMIRSIAFQTVEDRRAFLHEVFAPERSEENAWLKDLNGDGSHDWHDLAVEQEEVYRIEDTSGDGVADRSQRIVRDFHTEITDVAGAVLVHNDNLFVGVAPDMWRMQDTNGDGVMDTKESISHGYAVHIGFSGHGMSGLTVGPDGRIYWSIGDIGSNIVDAEGQRWAYPNQGAIFRSNPDGSNFEVFAHGLRNTHEFVFDKYGNLISVDNDGDHPGESERVVYIVEGSDSGWRSNWQYGKYVDPKNNDYKVWMDEEMYKPRFEGQAAYFLPPIANYHSGPAGMAYNPGTALGESWRDRFFVAEFTGSPARSHVFAFRLEPEGAGFEFAGEKVVTRGILATGIDFGPDGALYVADWIEGWGTKNEGRIWKVDDPTVAGSPLRVETEELLAADFTERSEEDLAGLLQHADMRVRQKAQFELAARGATETLLAAARQTEHQLARLHGLWGIWQLAQRDLDAAEPLVAFLTDADPEVRAQAARILGDVRYAAAADKLIPMLQDASARVRFFAAQALGRMAHRPALQPLIDMLEANDGEDVYLRQAGSLALARIGDPEPLIALADSPSRALRVAAVVALRRMQHPGVAHFLQDEDEYVVTEAARAINDDWSIEEALPELARVLRTPRFSNEALIRRAINANLRLGEAEHAQAVAAYAAREDAPEEMRVEALATLGVWPNPSVLDRVDGRYRGEVHRDTSIAHEAIASIIEPLLQNGSVPIKVAAAETVGRLKYAPAAPTLVALLEQDPSAEVRTAALNALYASDYEGIDSALQMALADREQGVRMRALELAPTLDMPQERIVELLASVLGSRSIEEQQAALASLGSLQSAPANEVLAAQFDQLTAGELPPELHLDLIEAVEASGDGALTTRLTEYRAAIPQDDPVAVHRAALYGGDPVEGRTIFFRNEAAQCTRCHAVGEWGGNVGPNLATIGTTLSREQLLEALVDPSTRIAPGFGAVALTLQDGEVVSGTVTNETDDQIVLTTGSGEARSIAKDQIAERQDAGSGMPPMGLILTRRELRDVVAFLSTLGTPQQPTGRL